MEQCFWVLFCFCLVSHAWAVNRQLTEMILTGQTWSLAIVDMLYTAHEHGKERLQETKIELPWNKKRVVFLEMKWDSCWIWILILFIWNSFGNKGIARHKFLEKHFTPKERLVYHEFWLPWTHMYIPHSFLCIIAGTPLETWGLNFLTLGSHRIVWSSPTFRWSSLRRLWRRQRQKWYRFDCHANILLKTFPKLQAWRLRRESLIPHEMRTSADLVFSVSCVYRLSGTPWTLWCLGIISTRTWPCLASSGDHGKNISQWWEEQRIKILSRFPRFLIFEFTTLRILTLSDCLGWSTTLFQYTTTQIWIRRFCKIMLSLKWRHIFYGWLSATISFMPSTKMTTCSGENWCSMLLTGTCSTRTEKNHS